MNSEKFTIQNSLEANYLNIRLDSEDRLDEIAVKVIQKDCPDFLIPFRIVSVNEETSLKYKLINTVALEYAEMTLPKALFVQFYLNLLEPFIKGKDWFLDCHNLCVDTRYVYVDKHTYNVFYLYVPVRSFSSTDQEILDFFKNVFINITISDDKDFQVRLFRFFGGGHITLAGLYQLMLEEKGTALSRPAPSRPVSQQPELNQPAYQQPVHQQPAFPQAVKSAEEKKTDETDSRKKLAGKEAKSLPKTSVGYGEDNGEDEVVQALFGNDKKGKKDKSPKEGKKDKSSEKSRKNKATEESKKAEKDSVRKKQDEKGHGGLGGLFGGRKKQQAAASAQSQSPEYTAEPDRQAFFEEPSASYASGAIDYAASYGGYGSDETEVSEEAGAVGIPWLELIDFSQPGALQRIDLNFTKPYITIGRVSSDEKRPDVAFPEEFKRIGRQHARIERRGNDFFVIDLGSVNHTMVNGQVMAPNQPYRLQDGMELAFTSSKPVRYRVHI